MHAPYLLLALVTASHAWYFSAASAPVKTPWRSLHRRDDLAPGQQKPPTGNLPENSFTKFYCPQATQQEGEGYTKKRIDPTELAVAQQKALDFCGAGTEVDPAAGTHGHVFTNAGANVQLCNFDDKTWSCNATLVSHMLAQIGCGSPELPSEGFGVLIDKSSNNANPWYVYYTPNAIGNCLDKDGFNGKKWEDPPANAGPSGGADSSSQGDGGDGDASITSSETDPLLIT